MKKESVVVNKQVILNSIQDLQRLSLSLLNSMRERYPAGRPIKYGMTALFNNGGFTLIELLVVVLIIGILAAVAVPQYQTAVTKSRLTQSYILGAALQKAEEVYFLSQGKYTLDMSELDISAPGCVVDTEEAAPQNGEHVYYNCSNDTRIRLYTNGGSSTVYTYVDSKKGILLIEYRLNMRAGKTCASDYKIGKKACLAIGGIEGATYGEITYFNLP